MSALDVPHASRGWMARLELGFAYEDHRTRLTRRRHEGPLLVQKPWYPESEGACHVCIVHPPGGVASGDDLKMTATVGPAAHALLTTPASGKFYRRGSAGAAHSNQYLNVQDAVLEWLPQENIFYPHAAADLRTIVRLNGIARFIGWELACLGLPACDATFGSGAVRMHFELWKDDIPLLLEHLVLDEARRQARWGMAGHAALGTALFYPARKIDLETANEALAGHDDCMTVACTLVDEVLVCRGLAHRADRLKGLFIHLWRTLRPGLLGLSPVAPRIWAT